MKYYLDIKENYFHNIDPNKHKQIGLKFEKRKHYNLCKTLPTRNKSDS